MSSSAHNHSASFVEALWVTEEHSEAAQKWVAFLHQDPQQRAFMKAGFRFKDASPPHRFDMFVFGGLKLSNDTRLRFNIRAVYRPRATLVAGSSPRAPSMLSTSATIISSLSAAPSSALPQPPPHLAGLAALLLELRPDLKAGGANDHPVGERAALRHAVLGTAVDLGVSGRDNTFGSGRASGLSAVMALSEDFNRDAAYHPLILKSPLQ